MSKTKKARSGYAAVEDEAFMQVFAQNVAREIAKYPAVDPKDDDALLQRQKAQVEALVDFEDQARKALIKDPNGLTVYEAFVRFINEERRNALAAQPFFRVPEDTFITEIGPAIKQGFVRSLFKYHFNHGFVAFARKTVQWPKDSEFWVITEKLIAARRELTEMNLPLAISRARLFRQRTPKSHMEYLDLVQCAVEGLLAAIDKFRLPYRPVFRSVAIGRMTGVFIERYSDTMIRFTPSDRRNIYRANKAMRRQTPDDVNMDLLLEVVNYKVEDPKKKATKEDLSCLMSAVSCLSMDYQVTDGEGAEVHTLADAYASPEEDRPDVAYEAKERLLNLHKALGKLPMIQQKVIRLSMGLEAT